MVLDWRVHFSHTWREENNCVDWLATFGLSLDYFVVIRLEYPPSDLQRFLFYDIFRACWPRHVQLIV